MHFTPSIDRWIEVLDVMVQRHTEVLSQKI
jgi:hypothetical protein